MRRDDGMIRRTTKRIQILIISVFLLSMFVASQQGIVQAAGPSPVNLSPSAQTVNASTSFVVSVRCTPQQPVKAFELKLSFNPSLVRATSVTEGDIFEGYQTFFNAGEIDNSAGRIINIYNLIVGSGNVTSAGSLVDITFSARTTSGTSPLTLYDVRLTNETAYLTVSVTSGSVTVTGGSNPPPNPPPDDEPDTPPDGENTPPDAPTKPFGPTLVEVGTAYLYNSSALDSDEDTVRLRFDWGDGSLSPWSEYVQSGTAVSMAHAWMTVSNYLIRVIAQDTNGENSSWSESLTVMISQVETEGYPPVGSFTVPQNVSMNHSMVFDASSSFDPDGSIQSYSWDFGDGTSASGPIVVHTYGHPGEYTVILTVTDNAGMNYSFSQTVNILDTSEASTGFGLGLLKPNEIMIVAVALGIMGMVLYGLYRFRTRDVTLQKRIEVSKQRLALIDQDTADIDRIVDALFAETRRHKQTPRMDTMLDAYNELIVGRVERNPAIAIPAVSIIVVEDLVDRRIHDMIVKKIDTLKV